MKKTKAVLGDWNMTCDRSGKVYPRSEMKQEWTGRWVHYTKWEAQHPQEIITPKRDDQTVWPVRSESEPIFISNKTPYSGSID